MEYARDTHTHTPLQLEYRTWDRRLSWAACPFRLGRRLLQIGEDLNHAVLCAGGTRHAHHNPMRLDRTPEGSIPLTNNRTRFQY